MLMKNLVLKGFVLIMVIVSIFSGTKRIEVKAATWRLPDGWYYIVTKNSKNGEKYAWDVSGGGCENAARLIVYPFSNYPNEWFYVKSYPDGTYSFMALHSKKYIHVSSNRYINVGMVQWENDGENARFYIEYVSDNCFRIKSKSNSGYVDNYGGVAEPCNPVNSWWPNDSDAQIWEFVPYSDNNKIVIKYYSVNANNGLNLRTGASTKNSIITAIPKGKEVQLLEDVGNEWFKVSYNGYVGYVASEYLSHKREEVLGEGSTYVYNNEEYKVVKNFSPEYCFKQTTSNNCTSTSANIAVSLARNAVYKRSGWIKGAGATFRDQDGTSILYKGYADASAQEKLNTTARIINELGAAVVIRLGDASSSKGHTVVSVGYKLSTNLDKVKESDLLIIDPAKGTIRNLGELQSSSYYHGGVQSYTGWSLFYSCEFPRIEGFRLH